MGGYRGVDRRRATALVPVVDVPRLAIAAASIVTAAVASFIWLAVDAGGVSEELSVAAAAVAATILMCTAVACALLHRVTGDCRAVHVGLIAGLVGASQIFTAVFAAHSQAWQSAASFLVLPAAWHFVALSRTPEIDTEFHWWRPTLVSVSAGAVLFGVVGALVAPPIQVAQGIEIAGWTIGTIAVGRAVHSGRRHLMWWLVVFGHGLVIVSCLELDRSSTAVFCGCTVMAIIGAFSLGGVMVEVRRAYSAQQRGAVAALAEAAMATMRAQSVDDTIAERLHEARSALAGIGAAALSISRFRDLMEPQHFDELSNGMLHEVARLRALIEDDAMATVESHVDVSSAIAPVVSLARATGMTVAADIEPGYVARSSSNVIAQVATALVANANRHAPGSPVEIWLGRSDTDIVVTVADRGPGLGADECEVIFERGVTTGGSGLGLYVARSQLSAIGGTVTAAPRDGGGAEFTVRLPRVDTSRHDSPSHGSPVRSG